jgi:hypothetical protein
VNYQNMNLENESAADTLGGVPPDTETSSTILPGFYIGTQHEFTDWLELRAGASKSWGFNDPDGVSENSFFPFEFALGAGIAVGDWQVDLGLNTNWLYNSGYWFHGSPGDDIIIGSIQAKLFF